MPPKKKTKTSHSRATAAISGLNGTAKTPESETESNATDVAKPRRNVRGRRGGLKDMPNMPFDIIMEIVQLLHPRDVLNLARTTKGFRAFLMDRKQEFLWKAARANVEGLPALPPWLCEPSYANLMFFPHCHKCLKPNIQHAYYAFGVRYCKDRCEDNIVPRKHIEPLLNDVQGELGKHAKDPYLVPEAGRSRRGGCVYFKPQIDDFRRKWAELSDREEQIRFVQECQKDTDVCLDISRELEKWASNQKENRKREREDLIAARIQAVEDRLDDEGWDKELAFMSSKDFQRLHNLPAVCKPAALTDRAWKNMQNDVVALMQGYRHERLVYERRSLLFRRMRLMREALAEHLQHMRPCEGPRTMADDLAPRAGDIAYLPQFREVIEAKSEVAVTKESFAPLLTSWPKLSAIWTAQHKAHFTEMLLPALKDTKAPDVEEVLDLAIATFRCLKCQAGNLRWPFVLIHSCFRSWSINATETDFDFAVRKSTNSCDVFNGGYARCGTYVHELRDIISTCGQDPDTATWQVMQERPSPARLICKDRCLQPNQKQVFDWRAAFDHVCTSHRYREVSTGVTRWQLVSEEEASKATKFAEALDALNKAEWYRSRVGHYNIACSWCTSYCSRASEEVRTHLKEKHGQAEPREGVDYSASHASLMRIYNGLPPVWIYSADLADNKYIKRMVEEGKGFFTTSPADASEASVLATSDI